ncbi:MAG: hypothetical protein EPN33_07160 [Acidobacteria bacterium]|nr:MAG: hypothetical protein EPN33_07160 [Acidobacteriota bacterium]
MQSMAQNAREDQFTQQIERQTARIPSIGYLGMAIASMGISAGLKLARRDSAALFVGQWAAPILLMGVYNKLVKQLGSHGENISARAA